ncbi:MAG: phage holin family protein, partial [Gaiellales bacterium]
MSKAKQMAYGEQPTWDPVRPRFTVAHVAAHWIISALSLYLAVWMLPGIRLDGPQGAFLVVAFVAILNALLAPLVAAIRLPFSVALGFIISLLLSAVLIQAAATAFPGYLHSDNFGWSFATAFLSSAVGVVIAVVVGVNDDDLYTLRLSQRIARRQGGAERTDVPGIVLLEIDGLALPVLQRAIRDGNVPNMARWLADGSHVLTEWETDLSSQTGASQAGILLGSNDDMPAFRWVEKETGRLMTSSAPADCAEIERRHLSDRGLLRDGGASRGNLLSGGAEHCILTVSRMDAETKANPGYRAFFANATNAVQTLILFLWEVGLELVAASRQRRRKVVPRGHRGGIYPLMRGALCVVVRDLIVFSVLQDMMKGRPIMYATFSSYDEVAHHSGLERADTLDALRKLDVAFGRIEKARRYAPRPYELVVLSDHGQTQGSTFKQRNGYGLDDLVQRNLAAGAVADMASGDENATAVTRALDEATGHDTKRKKNDVSGEDAVVLGSGNLGLIYLMHEKRRLTREEIDARHPDLIPALTSHPHVGWVLVRSEAEGAVVLGGKGRHILSTGRIEGEDPLAGFSPNAPAHLLRTDGFTNVGDLMVGSFFDPVLEQGCAFEELISFHGGLGGPQTQPFVLYPAAFPPPPDPLIGAAAVHE